MPCRRPLAPASPPECGRSRRLGCGSGREVFFFGSNRLHHLVAVHSLQSSQLDARVSRLDGFTMLRLVHSYPFPALLGWMN
jgi:hypothetical protein